MVLEHLCCDVNEIESGVEVDDNDGFTCVCVCVLGFRFQG